MLCLRNQCHATYVVNPVEVTILQHLLDRLPIVSLLLRRDCVLHAVALKRRVDIEALVLALAVQHVLCEAQKLSDNLVERVKRVARLQIETA